MLTIYVQLVGYRRAHKMTFEHRGADGLRIERHHDGGILSVYRERATSELLMLRGQVRHDIIPDTQVEIVDILLVTLS